MSPGKTSVFPFIRLVPPHLVLPGMRSALCGPHTPNARRRSPAATAPAQTHACRSLRCAPLWHIPHISERKASDNCKANFRLLFSIPTIVWNCFSMCASPGGAGQQTARSSIAPLTVQHSASAAARPTNRCFTYQPSSRTGSPSCFSQPLHRLHPSQSSSTGPGAETASSARF